MKIGKIAQNFVHFLRDEIYYKNARIGMHDILSQMAKNSMIERVLLSAYIGWSPKEGSGIFDPINRIDDIEAIYYRLDATLSIDIEDLKGKFMNTATPHKNLAMLIHYFGFMNNKYTEGLI